MNQTPITLQVLLVEDNAEDLEQYCRDFPEEFQKHGVDVVFHPCEDFNEAKKQAADPLFRFDLIVSDTYRGDPRKGDAQVLEMVHAYQGARFCPLVVYSSGPKPAELEDGVFLVWADKGKAGDIERAIEAILATNVPQLARGLHNQLDSAAASYLWKFLETSWDRLSDAGCSDPPILERLIRRRASTLLGDIDPASEQLGLAERSGAEYYSYPALGDDCCFMLGDIIRTKEAHDDVRVIVTPHCYLYRQPNQEKPRADHVLALKTVGPDEALGQGLPKAKAEKEEKALKKVSQWARSPALTGATPNGRHWYLPGFLEIPHLFCDFLQAESIGYDQLCRDYERVATLVPPYAEALQFCFASFFGSVGIPDVIPQSIASILD